MPSVKWLVGRSGWFNATVQFTRGKIMSGLRGVMVWGVCCLVGMSLNSPAMAQYYGGYPTVGGYGTYGVPGYSSSVGLGVYGAHSSWGIGVPSGSYYGIGAYPGGYYSSDGYHSGGYVSSPYGVSGGDVPHYHHHGYSSGYGYGGRVPVYVAPAPVLGTTTTIVRGGPTGGVVEYTNNGNGYTYSSDSSYPSVITQSPIIGPSRTYVVDGPKPVVVESRRNGGLPSNALPANSSQFPAYVPAPTVANIKLSCPKSAPGPLSYSLNGHVYTIKPGYSQTFPNDRDWKIEFKRGDDASEVASYPLATGNYAFVAGPNGWDLQQPGVPTPSPAELPPAPIPPAPVPAP